VQYIKDGNHTTHVEGNPNFRDCAINQLTATKKTKTIFIHLKEGEGISQ